METASLVDAGSPHFEKTQGFVTPGFQELYQKYSAIVFKTALRVTGNSADAEDVLQTVFLHLLNHQLLPDPARTPEHYLRRAATNTSIDLLRRKAAQAESEFEDTRNHGARENSLLLKDLLRRVQDRPFTDPEQFVKGLTGILGPKRPAARLRRSLPSRENFRLPLYASTRRPSAPFARSGAIKLDPAKAAKMMAKTACTLMNITKKDPLILRKSRSPELIPDTSST